MDFYTKKIEKKQTFRFDFLSVGSYTVPVLIILNKTKLQYIPSVSHKLETFSVV
jgi:hypothetical protein